MKEQYITKETAELSKKSGFVLTCGACYFEDKFYINQNIITLENPKLKGENYQKNVIDKCVFSCTQSVLLKWLREEKNIISNIIFNLFNQKWNVEYIVDLEDFSVFEIDKDFNKYEDAVEFALKNSLEITNFR